MQRKLLLWETEFPTNGKDTLRRFATLLHVVSNALNWVFKALLLGTFLWFEACIISYEIIIYDGQT